jgi:hypothetical protein
MRRWFALGGMLGLSVIGTHGVAGCSSEPKGKGEQTLGAIALPLGTYGPSGTRYRLRDATFLIYDLYGDSDNGYGGEGGSGSGPNPIIVSSETDLDADSINVSVEQGYYYVSLEPGWRMEKSDDDGTYSNVEAQLLSSSYQWVYVAPHSTSWAEYNFGIGGREVWFNGKLNIGINVYEDPDDYYGGAGAGN